MFTRNHRFAARTIAMGFIVAAGATSARAQYAIHLVLHRRRGATSPGTGGTFTLAGTVGQPDAGQLFGGAYACLGGFWAGAAAACYANCDSSSAPPVLNANDFQCFLNKFATHPTHTPTATAVPSRRS